MVVKQFKNHLPIADEIYVINIRIENKTPYKQQAFLDVI